MKCAMVERADVRTLRTLHMRIVLISSVAMILLIAPRTAGAADEMCGSATVWASPSVVNYQTVIRGADKHRSQPNFTVFIELPDGSAANIDPGSITLNGVPVLPEPSGVGDENGNGVDDLMVKSERSALANSNGLVRVAGKTISGSCFAGETVIEILCVAVERSDYFIDFTTSSMPDAQFNGLVAKLEVHRVKPATYCPNVRALVLVPGRTIAATAAFDLQYQDYSLMERLAMRGIDTFAFSPLGFGLSALPSGSNPLDDACNASLPAFEPDGTCKSTAGCDSRQGLPASQSMDQQGSNTYLNPIDSNGEHIPGHNGPLEDRCAHTSKTRFQIVTDQVAQLQRVVNDVLSKTGLDKVHLLGASFGGPVVGKYLGDIDGKLNGVGEDRYAGETMGQRQAKVAGVIFQSSIFRPLANAASPNGGTWPLGLISREDAIANFNVVSTCPGQVDAGIPDALWAAIQAGDPIGATWGPQPTGLSRYPIVPRFGWNDAVTTRIPVPALVMNGLNDSVVPVARSVQISNSSPAQVPVVEWTSGAQCLPGYAFKPWPPNSDPALPTRCRLDNRILVQLDCASHGLLWETCSGENCVDPHKTAQRRIADWILTGK